MGWKKIKEHYGIDALVHAEDGVILIGSGYIPRVIQINPDGKIVYDAGLNVKKFQLLEERLRADPIKLMQLLSEEDVFAQSLPVYTWKDGAIVECFCEEYGWPNNTHDGAIMYENVFFSRRSDAIDAAIRSAKASIDAAKENIAEARSRLQKIEDRLRQVSEYHEKYQAEKRAIGS